MSHRLAQDPAALPAPAWPGDDAWGPRLPGHLDFTLFFEDVFFGIIPSIAVFIITPLYLRYGSRVSPSPEPTMLLYVQLLSFTSCFASMIYGAEIWIVTPGAYDMAQRSMWTTGLASLCAGLMLFAGRCRGDWPIYPIVYAVVTVVLDAIRLRSHRMRGMDDLVCIYTSTVLLKSLCLACVAISWRVRDERTLFRSRSMVSWLFSTLWLGFKKTVQLQDLPELDVASKTEVLFEKFLSNWNKIYGCSRWPLLKACAGAVMDDLIKAVPSRFAYFGFTFAQPLLIHHVTMLVNRGQPPPDVIGRVTAITAVVFLGIGISKGYYRQMCHRVSASVRGILTTLIFDKALQMDREVLAREENMELLTVGLDTIQEMPLLFHELWIGVIEAGVGIWMLRKYVGLWCCLVFIPGGLLTHISTKLKTRKTAARQNWDEKTAYRAAATSRALDQLPGIHTMGLASLVSSYLKDLHVAEIQSSLFDRRLRVATYTLDTIAETITPLMALVGATYWVTFPTEHSASEVFTVLSLVSIVSSSVSTIVLAIPQLSAGIELFRKLERFFNHRPVIPHSNGLLQTGIDGQETDQLRFSKHSFPMELKKAILLAPCGSRLILKEVSLKFPSGGLTMIRGPPRCGKSTLTKVLLGEKYLDDGFISRPKWTVAYCDDTPWLVDGSVSKNVLGGHEYVEEWYRRIAWACMINDLEGLLDDNGVPIESNASRLGAELKQCVQIARAAYARPNLLILDDVFRGVNEAVASVVLERLFGPGGVLRLLGITTVMTTGNDSHLAVADAAYQLDGHGSMKAIKRPARNTSTVSPKRGSRPHYVRLLERAEPEPKPKPDQAQPKKIQTESNQDMWSYYFLFDHGGWRLTFFCTAFICWTAVSERIPPIYVRIWLSSGPQRTHVVGYSILTLATPALFAIAACLFHLKLSPKLSRKLNQMLLDNVFNTNMRLLSRSDRAMVARVFQDLSLLTENLPKAMLEASYLITLALTDLTIVLTCNDYLINGLVALPVALFFLMDYYTTTYNRVQTLAQKATESLLARFTYMSRGIMHVRAMRQQRVCLQDCERLLRDSLQSQYGIFCIQRWLQLVVDAFVAFLAVVCVSSSLFLANPGSEAAVGLSMLNLVTIGTVMVRLFESWVDLQTSFTALNRLKYLTEKRKPRELPQHDRRRWNLTLGKVNMYSITTGWDGTYTDNDAIRNVSLQIPPFSKVAIMGSSGSGKSSLLLCILNLLDCAGSISIDSTTVSSIHPELLRTKVISLPQEGVELAGSIRHNMDPWATGDKFFSDAELYHVLDRMCIRPNIQAAGGLSQDFATAPLSRAEKTLIFVARAVLRKEQLNARLVLIDDITSGLDERAAKYIHEILENAFVDCTVLMVTNRQDAIDRMDKIVEFEEGRIINLIDHPQRRKVPPGFEWVFKKEQSPSHPSGLYVEHGPYVGWDD